MIRKKTLYCRRCGQYVHAEKEDINWILHIILSFLTYGFWLIVLLVLYMLNADEKPWICPHCKRLIDPDLPVPIEAARLSIAQDFPRSATVCPECNNEILPSSKYCSHCGAAIKER